jgi:hypothetical protein
VTAHYRNQAGPVVAEAVELARWWLAELDSIVREVLRTVAPRRFNDSVLTLGADGGTLLVRGNGDPHALAVVTGPDGVAFADAEASQQAKGLRARIALASDEVLAYDVKLPAKAERELRAAIDLDVERSLPIARRDVLVDFAVTERQRETQQITVRVSAAHRTRVETAQAQAVSLGLRVVAIGVATPNGEVEGNFLDEGRPRSTEAGMLNRRLLTGLAASALVGIGTLLGQQLYERNVVQRELAALEPLASAARDLERQISARQPLFRELAAIMRAPDSVDALIALTSAVPDENWVQNVEILAPLGNAPALHWTGFSAEAGGFVETLQRSPDLADVTLVSTVTTEGQPARLELTAVLRASTPRGAAPGGGL